ncbi:MAG: SRPBCC family protein [Jatrophihabitans sp.]
MQPQIHLIDETWIDAPVERVSAVVADPANWRLWWPTLQLTVTRDRGVKGIQWAAVAAPAGRRGVVPVGGTVEIWLEPLRNGVLLHHYLRLDPIGGRQLGTRAAAVGTRRLAWHAKRAFWQLKDELEAGPSR